MVVGLDDGADPRLDREERLSLADVLHFEVVELELKVVPLLPIVHVNLDFFASCLVNLDALVLVEILGHSVPFFACILTRVSTASHIF